MPLNDKDIKIIERIVEKGNDNIKKELRGEIKASADGLRGEIKASEDRINHSLRGEIRFSEERVNSKLHGVIIASEERTIKTINREIVDLAEINRAFIEKHDDHDRRIKRLEIKTGLT